MRLKDVLAQTGAEVPLAADADGEVASVVYDSRQAAPGSLFVAIRGFKSDGNQFVDDAIRRGTRVVVSETPRPAAGAAEVAWVRVPDARKALALIAANFFGHPAEKLQLVAVTGTNGKTTTGFLIDSIVRAAGHESGLFGTIVYRTPRAERPAATTTPESLDLQRFLAEVVEGRGTHAVLEASSHALALDRLWGCHFAAAVFTNLTRDHLDFHQTFEDYFAAKRRLFEGTGAGAPARGIVNHDDPYGKRLAGLAGQTITYGLAPGAQVTAKKTALQLSGLEFVADTPAGKLEVRSALVGRINVYNILAAIAAGLALGFSRHNIEAGIRRLEAVPGRFERVDLGQPFLVIVDYAHTDDALKNLIATAREIGAQGRIITLFGCGGDRDRAKRPMMGEAAGRLSDVVVLTSDNPRSEDPRLIINDALVGLQRTEAKVLVEADRARAVDLALDQARPGDIVLLAGKGHENKQLLKDGAVDFDDREVARRVLRSRGYGE
jgi:UDP-N-acetylmuramoyl-L-alanyl-D-glutamate--2,6-diaminopimelate ligase